MAPARSTPPSRHAHRPSAREAMLDAAEAHLGADGTLTLDSAARAAGVTKPGLMYHFSTKEQLLGFYVVDVADLDEALEIARDLAAANPGGAYELRPVLLYNPDPRRAG